MNQQKQSENDTSIIEILNTIDNDNNLNTNEHFHEVNENTNVKPNVNTKDVNVKPNGNDQNVNVKPNETNEDNKTNDIPNVVYNNYSGFYLMVNYIRNNKSDVPETLRNKCLQRNQYFSDYH